MVNISISFGDLTKRITYYPQHKVNYFEYFKSYISFNKTTDINITPPTYDHYIATFLILNNFKQGLRTQVKYYEIFIYIESCQFLLPYSLIYLLDLDTFYRKPIFDEVYVMYSELDKLLYAMFILDNIDKTSKKVISPNSLDRNKLFDPKLTGSICFVKLFDNFIQDKQSNLIYWLFKTFRKWIEYIPLDSLTKLDVDFLKKIQFNFCSNNVTMSLLLKYCENNDHLELLDLLNNTVGNSLHHEIINYILNLSKIDLNRLFEKINKINENSYLHQMHIKFPIEREYVSNINTINLYNLQSIINDSNETTIKNIYDLNFTLTKNEIYHANNDIIYLEHNKVHTLSSDVDYTVNNFIVTTDKTIYNIGVNNKFVRECPVEYALGDMKVIYNYESVICMRKNKVISYLDDNYLSIIMNIIVYNSLGL